MRKNFTNFYLFFFLATPACVHSQSMPSVQSFFSDATFPADQNEHLSVARSGGRTIHVENADELYAAEKQSRDGDIIYLGSGRFDLTPSAIDFARRITLQGTYNVKTGVGTTIFITTLSRQPAIKLRGTGTRFLNIRMVGPDSSRRTAQMKQLYVAKNYYTIPNSRGLSVMADNIEISGCEFSGWSEAAIYIMDARNVKVYNNYIHHNQREGLGYGVCLNKATASIYYNYFDWNRHDIAGTGRAGTCYDAQFNVVGSHKSSHSFDMHKIMDESLKTVVAGDSITIKNNWVYVKDQEFVRISGPTRYYVAIEDNFMVNSSMKNRIRILGATGREIIDKNQLLKDNTWISGFKRSKQL